MIFLTSHSDHMIIPFLIFPKQLGYSFISKAGFFRGYSFDNSKISKAIACRCKLDPTMKMSEAYSFQVFSFLKSVSL